MSIKLFITGTDTDAGKTYISVGILAALQRLGKSTIGIKPVASGCQEINHILYNNDALALQQASSIFLDYTKINPFAFAPAIAPHVAAKLVQTELSVNALTRETLFALNHAADFCLIEGAGGWHIPLNNTETLADYAKTNQFNVILVVGMRLGCLNHAILTMRALLTDNINVVGWVANCIDPHMQYRDDSIATLKKWFRAPCLGIVDYMSKPEDSLNISAIMELR